MTDFIQIVTTVDAEEGARTIARRLVETGLAACAQIIGPITSTYVWKGNIETAQEWQCLIKTRRDLFEKISKAIKDMHPYEVPEIVVFPVSDGGKEYMNWMRDALKDR